MSLLLMLGLFQPLQHESNHKENKKAMREFRLQRIKKLPLFKILIVPSKSIFRYFIKN